jgi:hypothetical protein
LSTTSPAQAQEVQDIVLNGCHLKGTIDQIHAACYSMVHSLQAVANHPPDPEPQPADATAHQAQPATGKTLPKAHRDKIAASQRRRYAEAKRLAKLEATRKAKAHAKPKSKAAKPKTMTAGAQA